MTPLPVAALVASLRGLAATWRVEVLGDRHRAAVAGGPFLFALWHHALLPLLWHHRHRGIALLVSQHRDGELVGSAAQRLGYRLIRGSSTRGGGTAFRGVLRMLARGIPVAITPDGPRGPERIVKPGIVRAAHLAGVPILPVSAEADRVWHAASWDRLLIPQPLTRVRVAYGPALHPMEADSVGSRADLATHLNRLTGVGRAAA